jgi:hypothetical protein
MDGVNMVHVTCRMLRHVASAKSTHLKPFEIIGEFYWPQKSAKPGLSAINPGFTAT